MGAFAAERGVIPHLTIHTHMKVFKYRSATSLTRDLPYLVSNDLFAPTASQLNDPTEALLNDVAINAFVRSTSSEVAAALNTLTELRHTVGIFSLSRTATDELMWAHYAESHTGYCVEYDLDRLRLEARSQWDVIDMIYSESPPELEFADIAATANTLGVTQKLSGHKSKRWAYEEELRIVTAESGRNNYAQAALTGIHFGLRCSVETIDLIRSSLANRGLRYFCVQAEPLSYALNSISMAPSSIDGVPVHHYAPVEEGAVLSEADLGEDAHLRPKLVEAVERVRKDPSCAKVVLVDFSGSGPKRKRIFVQFETTVRTPLHRVVNMLFDLNDLG